MSVRPRGNCRLHVRPVEFGGCSCAFALLLEQFAIRDKQHGSRTLNLLLLVLLLRRKDDCKELENYFLLKIPGREDCGRDKMLYMTGARFEELLNNVVPHMVLDYIRKHPLV